MHHTERAVSRRMCRGKRRFKSAGAARRSANERGMVPCRVYECDHCDGHHVTSSKVLHHDADQEHRELDEGERWHQDQLDRARGDLKVMQAQDRAVIVLSAEGYERLVDLIENPPPPSPKLIELMRRTR